MLSALGVKELCLFFPLYINGIGRLGRARTTGFFSGHATMGMLQRYAQLMPGEYEHLRNAVNVGGEWGDNVLPFKERTG